MYFFSKNLKEEEVKPLIKVNKQAIVFFKNK
jgi:hypothetical protein